VPIPEDEFADLKMTLAERMEFFNYCMQLGTVKNKDRLKLAWLRAKRSGQLYQNEEDAANSKAFEELISRLPPPAEPEAA
jgi:hypothetical protein